MKWRNKQIYPQLAIHSLFVTLSLLTVLTVVLQACSKHSSEHEPIPIQLYTGIRTRAAVDAFDGTPVCVACGSVSGSYTQCWDGVATGNEITLVPVRYYPTDGSHVYLRGFYPPAPLTEDGTLTYTLTGEEDLMLTAEQSGSAENPFTADTEKMLVHRHLLTQLSFRLKLDVENPEQYSIRSLRLNGLAKEVTLSLLTEKLECGTPAPPVILYDSEKSGNCFPFEAGVAELPGFVLVQPEAEFTIDLRLATDEEPENDLVYTGLPIHFEGGVGEGGISYTVSVEIPDPSSLDPKAVNVTATVGHWEDGSGGNGELVTKQL